MSMHKVSIAMHVELPPVDKLVLICISHMHNEELGYAWPTVQHIGRVVGITAEEADAAIDRLCERGLIARMSMTRYQVLLGGE